MVEDVDEVEEEEEAAVVGGVVRFVTGDFPKVENFSMMSGGVHGWG